MKDPQVLAHRATNGEDPSFQNSPIPPLYSLSFKAESLFSSLDYVCPGEGKFCLLPPREGVVFPELGMPGIARAVLNQC